MPGPLHPYFQEACTGSPSRVNTQPGAALVGKEQFIGAVHGEPAMRERERARGRAREREREGGRERERERETERERMVLECNR
jgi:hypothetical protein